MPPQIKKLWDRRNAVIFVWPGDEDLELAYDALRIVVPARDVVGEPGPGSPYTHHAAEHMGRPVPGTAVIEDVTVATAEGGYMTRLSVHNMCRFMVRDRNDLFQRGFNIVEDTSQITEAMQLGIPLYTESMIERAKAIISREMQRQKAYRDKGETPPVAIGQHNVVWAAKHLRQAGPQQQALSLDELAAAMEGRPRQGPITPLTSPPQAAAAEAAATLPTNEERVLEASEVFKAAQEAGVKLTGIEMTHLLTGSEAMIARVKVKIKAREIEGMQPQI